MKKRVKPHLPLEQLKEPDFAHRFKRAGETWDLPLKLSSMRKACGLSQIELARRVGTSQQQISRLESPSYEGHSLSMLRRVADALGASVRVEIEVKKQGRPPVVAETKAIHRERSKDLHKRSAWSKFELDFMKKEKADMMRNLRIVEALYKEAVTLGIIPIKNPLDGIEVDLRIAKVVNSV
ncbi:MAG: helix-turn-helix domain-containing protein [Syntrophaceae bacterium]|nr:helix-turn-helix domain-containing protein [Syntrophaceae bacterium]